MRKLFAVSVLSCGLAACQSQSASITFDPPALADCGPNGGASVVVIHWDARRAKPRDGVNVWINNEPTPERTGVFAPDLGSRWQSGDAVGSATTGKWMFAGTTLTLTDAHDDDVLARVKMPAAPCPR